MIPGFGFDSHGVSIRPCFHWEGRCDSSCSLRANRFGWSLSQVAARGGLARREALRTEPGMPFGDPFKTPPKRLPAQNAPFGFPFFSTLPKFGAQKTADRATFFETAQLLEVLALGWVAMLAGRSEVPRLGVDVRAHCTCSRGLIQA